MSDSSRNLLGVAIQRDHSPMPAGNPSAQRFWLTTTARTRILQHERQPLYGMDRIERQVSTACFQNRQRSHHHGRRAIEIKSNHYVSLHAERAQIIRQTVGAAVEFRVGQVFLPARYRQRGRILRRTLCHKFVDARRTRGIQHAVDLDFSHGIR